MFPDILSRKQTDLLPFLERFKDGYYLAGGTAIALHIGHRRSVDFDLFTGAPINKGKISREINLLKSSVRPIYKDDNQQDYVIGDVKCTFLFYPYLIPHEEHLNQFITLPSLLDMGAMRAFSLSRRSKWKNYVDLYFLLGGYFTITEVVERAVSLFPGQISEKLFRDQLAFHKDIDYTEAVDFVIPEPPSDQEIRGALIEMATDF